MPSVSHQLLGPTTTTWNYYDLLVWVESQSPSWFLTLGNCSLCLAVELWSNNMATRLHTAFPCPLNFLMVIIIKTFDFILVKYIHNSLTLSTSLAIIHPAWETVTNLWIKVASRGSLGLNAKVPTLLTVTPVNRTNYRTKITNAILIIVFILISTPALSLFLEGCNKVTICSCLVKNSPISKSKQSPSISPWCFISTQCAKKAKCHIQNW